MKSKFRIILSVLLVALIAIGASFLTKDTETGVQMASVGVVAGDVKNVKFEKFILKKFRHVGTWLSEVSSKQSWVNMDAIKIPKRGGTAPLVLINNTVYPIRSNRREDDHVIVALNKYDTENRIVTDDEVYAIAYDKEGDVNMELKEELEEQTVNHALHSISPSTETTDTPILVTTGENDGNGRARCTKKDIITFKKALDDRKVPLKGRILVLCNDHANDLLIEDAAFEKGYHNRVNGVISQNYYSFKIYEEHYTPKYVLATKVIIPFGAATAGVNSSIVFHKKSTCKATGSIKRFARKASEDPEFRQSKVGYKMYFGCFAIQDAGQGAMLSGVNNA